MITTETNTEYCKRQKCGWITGCVTPCDCPDDGTPEEPGMCEYNGDNPNGIIRGGRRRGRGFQNASGAGVIQAGLQGGLVIGLVVVGALLYMMVRVSREK